MRHPHFQGAANIGYELGTQLVSVGIDSIERLEDLGAREVWLRLRVQFPQRGDLATLLALQGAIDDVLAPRLSAEVTAELRGWRKRHLADE